MTILYPAPAPVKSGRRFGRGLLRSLPAYRADHTAADEAWLALDDAGRAAVDREADAMAGEAAALDRYTRGLACY